MVIEFGSGIDPAFLRRFDFILEMPDLPLKNKISTHYAVSRGKIKSGLCAAFCESAVINAGDFKPHNSGDKGT